MPNHFNLLLLVLLVAGAEEVVEVVPALVVVDVFRVVAAVPGKHWLYLSKMSVFFCVLECLRSNSGADPPLPRPPERGQRARNTYQSFW
jgi:hypothetical protein